ncbi:Hsp70 family protein [Nocardia jiangxiensis]|uniref:Hsp70 family protein n=1 Tax=Nocardia jiangxiensis TaxID=282685 RepID=A0ABW6SD28_9NOCA|nr:Hsp70 family protein [Nocardia jiangxiensis]
MSSVLGISVGASAIRVARPQPGNSAEQFAPDRFDMRVAAVGEQPVEDAAVEAILAALGPDIGATAIAYRSEPHARAVRAALARRQVINYELVPEVAAAVEFLQASGELQGMTTIALYDLGGAGLSVSVVDIVTRQIHHSERTSDISGDYLDSLIREQQIASGRIAHPPDPEGLELLDQLCRSAKEQLTGSTAVALPSEYGLVLLSQENFDALIMLAVESSARMTRDVITRSERSVQAVVAIGGCAQIPQVAKVLERWLRVPVLAPAHPETVIARGAALLARPSRAVAQARAAFEAETEILPVVRPDRSVLGGRGRSRRGKRRMMFGGRGTRSVAGEFASGGISAPRGLRDLSVAGVAVGALVVVAALGLALGWGPQVLQGDSQSTKSTRSAVPTSIPHTSAPSTTVTPPPADSTNASVAPPPEYHPRSESPAPTRPGPNTIIVVPGLPAIVVPTIPPLLPPAPHH